MARGKRPGWRRKETFFARKFFPDWEDDFIHSWREMRRHLSEDAKVGRVGETSRKVTTPNQSLVAGSALADREYRGGRGAALGRGGRRTDNKGFLEGREERLIALLTSCERGALILGREISQQNFDEGEKARRRP